MATTISLTKLANNVLVPSDTASAEALEKLKVGVDFKAVLTQPRNYAFHKKAFALAQVGFDAWEPSGETTYKCREITKSFERFRETITILAGYYTVEFSLNGEPRFRADSWSFANMDETTFSEMYSKLIDVILAKVLGSKWTREDVDFQVEKILRFS